MLQLKPPPSKPANLPVTAPYKVSVTLCGTEVESRVVWATSSRLACDELEAEINPINTEGRRKWMYCYTAKCLAVDLRQNGS